MAGIGNAAIFRIGASVHPYILYPRSARIISVRNAIRTSEHKTLETDASKLGDLCLVYHVLHLRLNVGVYTRERPCQTQMSWTLLSSLSIKFLRYSSSRTYMANPPLNVLKDYNALL